MSKLLVILLISLCILTQNLMASSLLPQSFRGRIERDLKKQAKQINKNLRKKKLAELPLVYGELRQRNTLPKKYNVATELPVRAIDHRSDYQYYASAEYAGALINAIESKAQTYSSMEEFIETTGEGKSAKSCRLKRQALLASGVTLASMAIAGGIMLAIFLPNVVAGTAVTIRPIAAAFFAMLGVGTPGSGLSLWWSSKFHCVGE